MPHTPVGFSSRKSARTVVLNMTGSPEWASRALNEAASEGLRYAGAMRLARNYGSGVGGAGVYFADALVRLLPAGAGSLFRVFAKSFSWASRADLTQYINELTHLQAQCGYDLVDTLVVDGVKGTESLKVGVKRLMLIFEHLAGQGVSCLLDAAHMRPERPLDADPVPCPVLGCPQTVPRMTRNGPNLNSPAGALGGYRCPEHGIIISPSTFAYETRGQNLIWRSEADIAAFNTVLSAPGGKRSSERLERERDEDSLTWNTFYGLRRMGSLSKLIATAVPLWSEAEANLECFFWSVGSDGLVPQWLQAARSDLGETPEFGTEPDLIVVGEHQAVIVEVKFGSSPITKPANNDSVSKYAECGLWPTIFRTGKDQVIDELGYEMTRLLLLGHALARRLDKSVRVLLVTGDDADKSLVTSVVNVCGGDLLHYLPWKQISNFVGESAGSSAPGIPEYCASAQHLYQYLRGRTLGYDDSRTLKTLLRDDRVVEPED